MKIRVIWEPTLVLDENSVVFGRISVDCLTLKMNKFTSLVWYADEAVFEI